MSINISIKPKSIILALLLSLSITITRADELKAPVIGILTEPSPYVNEHYPSTNFSYIAGSYIRFVEAAGGLAVPIQWDTPFDELDQLLDSLSAVIFPGGATDLHDPQNKSEPSFYSKVGCHIVERAMEYNKNGSYFPVWGTCLGYEMLSGCIANNFSILIRVHGSDNVAKELTFTDYGKSKSRLYQNFPEDLIEKIETERLTFFHHVHTVDPELFKQNQQLAGNVSITAYAHDPGVGEYVASYEGTDIPWMGTQFHPEKNTYEWWNYENIPHDLNAVRAEQYYAYHFVTEAKKSPHTFPSVEEYMKFSIYNYNPIHNINPEFEQVFIIPNYNVTHPSFDKKENKKQKEVEKFLFDFE